jgi:competence protein ComEC
LTGATFLMKGQETEVPLPAHEYGFDMHTYLKSHGAEGMLTVISMKQVSQSKGVTGWIAKQRFSMEKHIDLHFPLSLQAETKALYLSRDDVDPQQKKCIKHLVSLIYLHCTVCGILTFILSIALRLPIR